MKTSYFLALCAILILAICSGCSSDRKTIYFANAEVSSRGGVYSVVVFLGTDNPAGSFAEVDSLSEAIKKQVIKQIKDDSGETVGKKNIDIKCISKLSN